MAFEKIDNTSFVCNLYELYKSDISSYLVSKLRNLSVYNYSLDRKMKFDILFLTPTNLISN